MRSTLTTIILDRHAARHRGRLCLPHAVARSGDGEKHLRLHLADDRHLLAPDQDDHRAAGVLDAGRRRRAYGRSQDRRPHRRQGDAVVRYGVAGVAAAGARAGQHPAPRRQPQPAAARRAGRRPTSRSPRCRQKTSSRTWCRARSSRRWRPTRFCRSWCSRCSSASPARRSASAPTSWSTGIEELSHVILTITGYIMKLAPLAVFASMAAISHHARARHPGDLRQVRGRVLFRRWCCCGCLLVAVGYRLLRQPRHAAGHTWCASRSCSRSRPRAARRPIRR